MLITFKIRALPGYLCDCEGCEGPFKQNSAQLLSQSRLLPAQSPHTGGSVISTYLHADHAGHCDPVRNDTSIIIRETWQRRSQTPGDTWQQARGRNIFFSCRLNLNESCLRLDAGDRFELRFSKRAADADVCPHWPACRPDTNKFSEQKKGEYLLRVSE